MSQNFSCESFPGWANYSANLKTSSYLLVTVFTILTLPSIVFNALILITVFRVRSIQTTSNVFLCNLAASDLGATLISLPLAFSWKLSEFLSTDAQNTCRIANAFMMSSVIFTGVSVLTLTTATVDRYLALYLHLSYNSIVTVQRVLIICGGMWVSCSIFSAVTLYGVHVYHPVTTIFVSVCLPVVIFCYYKIYKVLKYHHLKINQSVPSEEGKVVNLLRYKKSVIGLIYVLVMMIVLLAPFACVVAVFEVSGQLSESLLLAWNVTGCLVFTNSTFNPLVYYWKIRELRYNVNETVSLCWGYVAKTR
ncbi:predicted protein [Nematostella vectensis]|uniref:G-protein coupled receptors family 1 profile domain-containing protein n=1 Tax=Nematostella vectensis TaxID=45351 RepID=A7RXU3_NEMVE|nr:predicted protein [Nematostella vectensis]|eukprot:XP_001635786.1 predicted protein [Nematostella vectensis]